MTENEDLELRRLEVNIGRLVQLVRAQDERIRQLQARLSLQDSAGERAAARQLLDGLIQEVERCIQQLEHE